MRRIPCLPFLLTAGVLGVALAVPAISVLPSWTGEADQATAKYGFSAGMAGDVNGDGYGDLVVGGHLYDNGETDEGRVYLHHGHASGLSTTAAWILERDQSSANLGFSVDGAGDVNRDGYADVIVGAWLYDNGEANEGRAWVCHGGPGGLSTTAAWTVESNQANARLGSAVCGAGDLNADGFADVAVGAYLYDNGQADEGRVYAFLGSAAGLSTTAAWAAESDMGGSSFGGTQYGGRETAAAGDVDGDGYADLLVGAYAFSNGQAGEGRVWLFHGSAAGLQPAPSRVFEPNVASTQFGIAVSGGDVDRDGFSDVVVGSATWSNGEAGEGRAFVYPGGSGGMATTAVWTAESHQANGDYGWYVGAADVNGDGFTDILVTADVYDNGQADEGRVYLYHGAAPGLSTTAAWIAEADQASAYLGTLAAARDVNGDGFSDVLATAYQYANGQAAEGRAFLYHGDGIHPRSVPEPGKASGNELGRLFSTAGCFLSAARR